MVVEPAILIPCAELDVAKPVINHTSLPNHLDFDHECLTGT